MRRPDVAAALTKLRGVAPAQGDDVLPIVARAMVGSGSMFFGVDERGAHCVLLSCGRPGAGFPTFRTEVLRCEFVSSMRVSIDGTDERHAALILRCDDAAEFADVFGALVEEIARLFSSEATVRAWEATASLLNRWSDFFRPPAVLSEHAATGLWGELWAIAASSDRPGMVAAWRGCEGAVYDFFTAGVVLEVKVGTRRGVHVVSHAQVAPTTAEGGLLSLEVLVDPAGTTLAELEAKILGSLSNSSVYYEALRRRGVAPTAMRRTEKRWTLVGTPSVFRLDDVPRVTAAQPGVSDLRYKITLDQDRRLDGSAASQLLSPFALELPKDSR